MLIRYTPSLPPISTYPPNLPIYSQYRSNSAHPAPNHAQAHSDQMMASNAQTHLYQLDMVGFFLSRRRRDIASLHFSFQIPDTSSSRAGPVEQTVALYDAFGLIRLRWTIGFYPTFLYLLQPVTDSCPAVASTSWSSRIGR